MQANDIGAGNVRAALASVKATIVPSNAAFAPDMPPGPLACAIRTFAQPAESEQPLALVLAEKSGKSRFVFTDRALYFRKALAVPQLNCRFPYDAITGVKKTREALTITTKDRTLQWNLAQTLLWERSRRRVADDVVTLLRAVLQGEGGSVTSPTVIEPASVAPVAADWAKVRAFHTPILLIGAPLMLLGYILLANVGILDRDTARVFEHIGPGRSLLFGALSLVPSMFAFGTRLRFSVGRYVIAVIGLTLLSLQSSASAAARGEDAVAFFPFGGGLLGMLLAFGLGNTGLRILRMFKKSP